MKLTAEEFRSIPYEGSAYDQISIPDNNVLIPAEQARKKAFERTRQSAYSHLPALLNPVGTARFELATPSTPLKCATWLRYVPGSATTLISA